MLKQITCEKDLIEATNQYAAVDRELTKAEADLNKEVDRIKNTYDARTADAQGRKKALGILIEGYTNEHRAELISEDKRSFDLPAATLGYRKTSSVHLPMRSMAEIISAIERMGRLEAVTIKKTANKDILNTWSTEALAEIGVKKEEKDIFFIKVNEEKI